MAQLGRTTRAYVNGYTRSAISVGSLRRREKREVIANFNGAIPVGDEIVSVTWRCTAPWTTFMSAPTISADQRETTVLVDFQAAGWSYLRADVTLNTGAVYNQVFDFNVRDSPWFNDELAPAAGPFSVTVTAPTGGDE